MSWKKELAQSITTPEQLAERFGIDPEPLREVVARYPLRITPHTLSLIEDVGDSIWRQSVPDPVELNPDNWPEDSMNEGAHAPAAAVVHRYPDRALLLVSGQCAGYCRFCTRKSRVGTPEYRFRKEQIEEGVAYIAATPEIRDVILTGGDPLLLDDKPLGDILTSLRRIAHLEIIRIGSRVPVTLPSRVTPDLCRILRRHAPLYLNTHFNHPRELTNQAAVACNRLADSGIVLGNQTVLLKGVNDDPDVLAELCRGLLRLRVRPYYLHHLDRAKGTGHYEVPVEEGLAIVESLRGKVSGLAIPLYVKDPPDGSGKIEVRRGSKESQS